MQDGKESRETAAEGPELSSIQPRGKDTVTEADCTRFEECLHTEEKKDDSAAAASLTLVEVLPGVYYIDNVLSSQECDLLREQIDASSALSFWCQDKINDASTRAFRNAETIEMFSDRFADRLWSRVSDLLLSSLPSVHMPDDPDNPDYERDVVGEWRPCGTNPHCLFARYPSFGSFAPHTDGRAISDFNTRSFYSIIVYLNSVPLHQGAGTKFYDSSAVRSLELLPDQRSKSPVYQWTSSGSLVRGEVEAVAGRMALFHQSWVHEGVPPNEKFLKYIIRSDVMFKREVPICDSAQDREAYELFRNAERVAESGHPDEAIPLFRRAFRMSPALAKNSALPSGAIDVIAIRQPDGSLSCSPFHVKLGQTCKKGERKLVKVRVNGKEVDVFMRLGPAGEAFFLKRTQYLEHKESDSINDMTGLSNPVEATSSLQDTEHNTSALQAASRELEGARARSLSENNACGVRFATDDASTGAHVRGDLEKNQEPGTSVFTRYRSVSEAPPVAAQDESSWTATAAAALSASSASDVHLVSSTVSTSSAATTAATVLPTSSNVDARPGRAPVHLPSSDFAWTWKWGTLPVKSRSNLQLDQVAVIPAEEKCTADTASPDRPAKFVETRETFDDYQERMASGKDQENCRPPPAASMRDRDEELPHFASPSASAPFPLFDVSSAASGKQRYTAVPSTHEYRECDEEPSDNRLFLPQQPSDLHFFQALSLCGDKLVGESAPQTSQELMEMLYTHRVPQEILSISKNLLVDDRLVVIAEDFLLNVELAQELLVSAGSDPSFPLQASEGADAPTAMQPISADAVQSAVMRMRHQRTVENSALSWIGCRISQWNGGPSGNTEAGAGAGTGGESAAHLISGHFAQSVSQTSLAYYTPTKNLSFDQVHASVESSLLGTEVGTCGGDSFAAWSGAGIGWKQSFTDLVEAFRLQRRGSEKSPPSHQTSARKGEAMSSIMESGREGDDYFFHHDSADDHEEGRPSVLPSTRMSLGSDPDKSMCDTSLRMEDSMVVETFPSAPVASTSSPPRADELEERTSAREALPMEPQAAGVVSQAGESSDRTNRGSSEEDRIFIQDVPFEDISPEPPDGDFYESDTDSYLSLSMDEDDIPSNNVASREKSSLSSLSIFRSSSNSARAGAGKMATEEVDTPRRPRFRKYRYKKVLSPSKEQLELFGLKDGQNELVFELDDCPPLISQLYVWPADAKIIVTDIDGVFMHTKKPNQGGSWVGFLGKRGPVYEHDAINYFRSLHGLGYRILYIADSPSTVSTNNTNYSNSILNIVENNLGQRLPAGPVFKSPDSLVRAFGPARTEVFKAAALRGVRSLFPAHCSPFYAAFASRESDVVAFDRNAFPPGRIFLVGNDGKVRRILQNRNFVYTMADLKDLQLQMFPKVNDGRVLPKLVTESLQEDDAELAGSLSTHARGTPSSTTTAAAASRPNSTILKEESYSDFSFWKLPIPALDDI